MLTSLRDDSHKGVRLSTPLLISKINRNIMIFVLFVAILYNTLKLHNSTHSLHLVIVVLFPTFHNIAMPAYVYYTIHYFRMILILYTFCVAKCNKTLKV